MQETKPLKRLVSKREYLRVIGQKLGLYSLAGFTLIFGTTALITTVALFLYTASFAFTLCCAGVLVAMGAMFVYIGHCVYVQARAVERVKPVTQRNKHLLPPVESLVRPSDLPPTLQEAELLRAASAGAETPAAELLRVAE